MKSPPKKILFQAGRRLPLISKSIVETLIMYYSFFFFSKEKLATENSNKLLFFPPIYFIYLTLLRETANIYFRFAICNRPFDDLQNLTEV